MVSHAHMRNSPSLTNLIALSTPKRNFCSKIPKLRELFAFYTNRRFTLFTQQHYLTENCEAVFISKLTCQFSSFFVQNVVQTTSTLSKQRPHFAKTTSTLRKERRQFCTNNDHILHERQLCTNNIEFERTTSTLQGQHPHSDRGILGASFRVEQLSEIVGYSNKADCTSKPIVDHNLRISSGKTMLMNKTSTFLCTWHVKNSV